MQHAVTLLRQQPEECFADRMDQHERRCDFCKWLWQVHLLVSILERVPVVYAYTYVHTHTRTHRVAQNPGVVSSSLQILYGGS